MRTPSFKQAQQQFAAYLRDPDNAKPPENIESRRLKVYGDLIFNNIDGFLQGGFPILHSLYDKAGWNTLVRDFIRDYRAHSPYFLEISEEFLTYLQQTRQNPADPPFMLELAHYEWVELALDVSTETLPPQKKINIDWLTHSPRLSPLAWNLCYEFPVHKIGPAFQPEAPGDLPTFLVVYRNRRDQIQFMEGSGATYRLLSLLSGAEPISGADALRQIASEMNAPDLQVIIDFGVNLMGDLAQRDIIF